MVMRLTALLVAVTVCGWANAQAIEPYESDEHTLLLYHFDGDGDEVTDSGPLGLHGKMNTGATERVEGIIGDSIVRGLYFGRSYSPDAFAKSR